MRKKYFIRENNDVEKYNTDKTNIDYIKFTKKNISIHTISFSNEIRHPQTVFCLF